jgi:signal peptidase II
VRYFGWPVIFAGLLFALDRVSKYVFMYADETKSHLFSSLITLTKHWNYGLIANLAVPAPLIIGTSCLAILGILLLWRREARKQHLSALLALACILAGAAGNLWDRLTWGGVFDWLLLGGRSVINLADITIFAGTLWYITQEQRNRKKSI